MVVGREAGPGLTTWQGFSRVGILIVVGGPMKPVHHRPRWRACLSIVGHVLCHGLGRIRNNGIHFLERITMMKDKIYIGCF